MIRIAILSALAACGTSSLPAGAQCSQTSECDANLMCLDLAQFSGSACSVIGKTCTKVCADDPGCTSLGSNFKCFAGCGSAMTCGATL
ncbi:MAG TPA: hypothetical protein VFQ65_17675 [Kofleriaceae bacterium]|nr:hypothetical protein [Kofleriaceae bacterium]